jgi:hypothetical protein
MYPTQIVETTVHQTDYFDFEARQKAMRTLLKYEVISEPEYQMLVRRTEDLDRKADGKPPIPTKWSGT